MKIKMKTKGTILLLFVTLLIYGKKTENSNPEPQVKRIWGLTPHNAFTDIIEFQNNFYCTFREAKSHVGGDNGSDGKIRILISVNGNDWRSIALLEKKGYDLRDSKLSITPEGKLMVLMGGTRWEGKKQVNRLTHVSFLNGKTGRFSNPAPVEIDKAIRSKYDWLWRVTWNEKDENGYGIVYQRKSNTENESYLLKTEDGIRYSVICNLSSNKLPGESTLLFNRENEMLAVIRNDARGKNHGQLGKARYPYDTWNWKNLGVHLGGPDMIELNNDLYIIGSRAFAEQGKTTTALFIFDDRSNEFYKIIDLPSGGDTSYPGMLLHQDQLWVSYYSSHEGKSQIYLARIPVGYIMSQIRK
jgi:hypothetical protein